MSKILTKASLISLAATFMFTLFAAAGPGAAAQKPNINPNGAAIAPNSNQAETAVEPLDGLNDTQITPLEPNEANAPAESSHVADTLAEMVSAQVVADDVSPQMKCLAGAIYFEARSESLEGQLAVGRVVINRSKSGRFPNTYCGVVYQPSQFSFVRGATMPAINQQSRLWQNALAIAQIADANSWQSPVEGALFFHSVRVSPSWRLRRVARVENHIFYQ